MKKAQFTELILKELYRTLESISEKEIKKFISSILEAKKIFVAGVGRSGFMAKAFAMRMMHLDLDSYVVGETITPNLGQDDIVIISTGSGETESLIPIAQKAKTFGATVIAVTICSKSTIGKLADIVIHIPAQIKSEENAEPKSTQPMGSLFEQALLILYDGIILEIIEEKGFNSKLMYNKHANLE